MNKVKLHPALTIEQLDDMIKDFMLSGPCAVELAEVQQHYQLTASIDLLIESPTFLRAFSLYLVKQLYEVSNEQG